MSNKQFTSNAQWPEGTLLGSNRDVSTDTHLDRAQAENVCTMLEDNGFGGEGEVFPVRTWVDEV